MIKIHLWIVRWLVTITFVVALVGRSSAALQLDASNDAGGSSTAHELKPSNFSAQSFTVTNDGLLSQVDVQLGKFAGATGNVTFELRPLVDGLPTIDDRDRLFTSTINIDDVPVIASLADPPPFVSVDVSGAGIHATPGDVYPISMRRSGGSPAAAWRSEPNTHADGSGFFRNLLNAPWGPVADDLGFQTWIDPTPTAPYKLRVAPTYDMQYRPGEVSSLIEGESALVVGGFPGDPDFPEQRPVMEFPLGELPAGAVIEGAHLEFDFYASSGAPRIEVLGFAGDGVAAFPDATAAGTILATTGPTSASSSNEVPIDASFVASLVGQASHLGVRMRSLDLPQYVAFNTLEAHSSLLPPQLVVEYTLAQLAGDYNNDGFVDAADYTVWRDNLGASAEAISNRDPGNTDEMVNQADYDFWKANFGNVLGAGASAHVMAVPEPATSVSIGVTLVGWAAVGRRKRK